MSAELVATYRRRTRRARGFMFALFLAWSLAIVVAVPAANAPKTSPLGPIAAWLFLSGLPVFMVGVVLLAQSTGTIPVRWRVVVGDDGASYLRIGNPSPAFAEALEVATSALTSAPGPQVSVSVPPGTRTHTPIHGEFLIPYAILLSGYCYITIRFAGPMGLIIPTALFVSFTLVAASLIWRIHIGAVFRLTPTNSIVILGIGALAGAFGLIVALDPAHSNPGGEAEAGIGGAIGAMLSVVIV